jgi:AmmeMemoRadiSam system protein B
VRPAAVAGSFYPDDPGVLAALVDELLTAVQPAPASDPPIALIAPHAGYRYSGSIAATAYAHLARWRGVVTRAVVLGPAHFVPLHGMALPDADAFATPLGPVAVDVDARAIARDVPIVVVDADPHAPEHSLETQLPFLVRTLGPAVRVLPVVVGSAPPAAIAALLDALLGDGTVAVVSTDLSHYLPRARAQERDTRTAAAVVACTGDALQLTDACGYHPLRGLLHHAAARRLAVELLGLSTSADTGGDPGRVVGYGAFVLRAGGG